MKSELANHGVILGECDGCGEWLQDGVKHDCPVLGTWVLAELTWKCECKHRNQEFHDKYQRSIQKATRGVVTDDFHPAFVDEDA